jgi:transposase
MARKSPYPAEMRARAVRMVGEVRPDYDSEFAAIKAVAARLDIASAETLRKWVRRAEVDAGTRPGIPGQPACDPRPALPLRHTALRACPPRARA